MGRKKKTIIDSKDAKVVLGEEKVSEIVNKEWKTAELPPEEALLKEQHESPKARNNPNSRKNLIQYKKDKPVEVKEAIIENLKYNVKRKERDLKVFFEDLITEQLVSIFEPMREALEGVEEEDVFFGIIKNFLKDFPKNELSASDVDDLANLSLNRILELRLLKEAKSHPKRILDIAAAIERFRKNSEKIKMSLASRRMDRIDTKNKPSFSIVDIVEEFDSTRRAEMEQRVNKFLEEEKKFLNEKNK